EEEEPASPGEHQRMKGGPARLLLLEMEADEEEGGDRDQLPENVEGDEIVGQDQAEHGGHEEEDEPIEGAEGTAAPLLLHFPGHICAREDQNRRRDRGHDQGKDPGEGVETKGE